MSLDSYQSVSPVLADAKTRVSSARSAWVWCMGCGLGATMGGNYKKIVVFLSLL